MSGPDSYYTPTPLAEKLVSYVAAKTVRSAVDFCVGDGDLLKAVKKRFEAVALYGTDISDEALEKLRGDCPEMTLGQCDFCKEESVDKVSFLHNNTFDLIVLNPPFTCKGSVVERLNIQDEEYKVSTAMSFLIRSLKYLSNKGGLYAILPISCVYSEKDSKAWTYLQDNYNACVLGEPTRVYFSKKCSPSIALVYVGRYKVKTQIGAVNADFSSLPVTSVVRGCVRMQNLSYSKKKSALLLIHTTNIQKGKLVELKKIEPGLQMKVDGCGVVIPRVCNPSPNKVALLDGSKTYLLSDCVIVLRTATQEDAVQVRAHILAHWSEFATIYKGTGAQYTTLARTKELFWR